MIQFWPMRDERMTSGWGVLPGFPTAPEQAQDGRACGHPARACPPVGFSSSLLWILTLLGGSQSWGWMMSVGEAQ